MPGFLQNELFRECILIKEGVVVAVEAVDVVVVVVEREAGVAVRIEARVDASEVVVDVVRVQKGVAVEVAVAVADAVRVLVVAEA